MSSLDTLLGVAVTKALANTSYEKRKQAALELEKLVRELGGEKIKQILLFLREYVESPTPNIRKGGLIGLAAVAIGLDTHSFLNKDPAVGQSQLAAAGGVGGRYLYFKSSDRNYRQSGNANAARKLEPRKLRTLPTTHLRL